VGGRPRGIVAYQSYFFGTFSFSSPSGFHCHQDRDGNWTEQMGVYPRSRALVLEPCCRGAKALAHAPARQPMRAWGLLPEVNDAAERPRRRKRPSRGRRSRRPVSRTSSCPIWRKTFRCHLCQFITTLPMCFPEARPFMLRQVGSTVQPECRAAAHRAASAFVRWSRR